MSNKAISCMVSPLLKLIDLKSRMSWRGLQQCGLFFISATHHSSDFRWEAPGYSQFQHQLLRSDYLPSQYSKAQLWKLVPQQLLLGVLLGALFLLPDDTSLSISLQVHLSVLGTYDVHDCQKNVNHHDFSTKWKPYKFPQNGFLSPNFHTMVPWSNL